MSFGRLDNFFKRYYRLIETKVTAFRRSQYWSFDCHAVVAFVVLVMAIDIWSAMTTQANDAETFPPVAPERESMASASPEFLNMCRANSSHVAAKSGWEVGKQIVTRSDTWGTVWRADFRIPGSNSTLINRIICWQQPSGHFKVMFAIGQDVPPL
jgi:hypothetical protein